MNPMPTLPALSDAPRTLIAFERRFQTEEDCRLYLEQLRWPHGFRCPCGEERAWRTAAGLLKCPACRRASSVTAGTIFHGSHLPLMVWFRAIWWATNHQAGVSALGLQYALSLGSYRTAWAMLRTIHSVMALRRRPLKGRIDVGIHCFCSSRRSCSSDDEQSWIAIAVEERRDGVGRIRMRRLPEQSAEELRQFLDDVVAAKSTVYADDPSTAKLLPACGYAAPASNAALPRAGSRIQLTAGLAKRWLGGTHQGRYEHKYLQEYLEAFSFRFNRRNVPHSGTLFAHLLEVAVTEPA